MTNNTTTSQNPHSAYHKAWRIANAVRLQTTRHEYYEEHKETEKARTQAWQKKHRKRATELQNNFNLNHPEKGKEYRRRYYLKNQTKLKQKSIDYRRRIKLQGERIALYIREEKEDKDLKLARDRVRLRDHMLYRIYQTSFNTETHIYHEWVPGSIAYTGIALVDAEKYKKDKLKIVELLAGEI